MIKFFRKIRQNLLSEGKTGKYLKYALGEIILVVLGILIALQINNWNENRKDRIQETAILNNLKKDFKSAIKEFQALNDLRYNAISSMKTIYEVDANKVKSSSTNYLDSLISKTMTAPTFNNQSGSLNVLLTSGKIDLISNQELKEQLIEWPGDVADMTEDEITHSKLHTSKYSTILDNYVSWNDIFNLYNVRGIRFKAKGINKMKTNANVTSNYKSLLNDIVFLNVLNRRIVFLELTTNETNDLIAKAQDIIKSINSELSNDKIL